MVKYALERNNDLSIMRLQWVKPVGVFCSDAMKIYIQ